MHPSMAISFVAQLALSPLVFWSLTPYVAIGMLKAMVEDMKRDTQ